MVEIRRKTRGILRAGLTALIGIGSVFGSDTGSNTDNIPRNINYSQTEKKVEAPYTVRDFEDCIVNPEDSVVRKKAKEMLENPDRVYGSLDWKVQASFDVYRLNREDLRRKIEKEGIDAVKKKVKGKEYHTLVGITNDKVGSEDFKALYGFVPNLDNPNLGEEMLMFFNQKNRNEVYLRILGESKGESSDTIGALKEYLLTEDIENMTGRYIKPFKGGSVPYTIEDFKKAVANPEGSVVRKKAREMLENPEAVYKTLDWRTQGEFYVYCLKSARESKMEKKKSSGFGFFSLGDSFGKSLKKGFEEQFRHIYGEDVKYENTGYSGKSDLGTMMIGFFHMKYLNEIDEKVKP